MVSIHRYTTASGAARYRARVKSHGGWSLGVIPEGPMRSLGSKISIGVCEVVSGWTHVEDE